MLLTPYPLVCVVCVCVRSPVHGCPGHHLHRRRRLHRHQAAGHPQGHHAGAGPHVPRHRPLLLIRQRHASGEQQGVWWRHWNGGNAAAAAVGASCYGARALARMPGARQRALLFPLLLLVPADMHPPTHPPTHPPQFCIMLPIVLTWAAKARLPVRQLLIPLSYCCLLGGLNTIIGTSTNLVVTGGCLIACAGCRQRRQQAATPAVLVAAPQRWRPSDPQPRPRIPRPLSSPFHLQASLTRGSLTRRQNTSKKESLPSTSSVLRPTASPTPSGVGSRVPRHAGAGHGCCCRPCTVLLPLCCPCVYAL